MRAGLAVSVLLHGLLVLAGLVSLSSSTAFDTSQIEAVPVDFVEIADTTSVDKGVKTASVEEEKVTEKPAEKVAEKAPPPAPVPAPPPVPKPVPVAEEPKPAPEEAAAPEETAAEEPQPAPLPEEPPPPAPAPVAEAPPPPAEPPPPPKAEPEKVVEKPSPVPRPRPTRPKIAQTQQTNEKDDFDPDEISALLDRSAPTGSTNTEEKPPTFGSNTPSADAQMTVNELDALRAKLGQCWNIQLAPPDPSDLRVKVKMYLNEDGSLAQAPEVLESGTSEFARTAVDSVLRAVRRCAPYDLLPAEKYAAWREISVTFDPREMFGG